MKKMFYQKYHVYDENGKPIYERRRVGRSYHQLVITFDMNAEEGTQVSVKEVPDIDEMPLDKLQEYYEELSSRKNDLEGEEPEDGESKEYEAWENELNDLEELMDEVAERLGELGGDV